MIMRRAKAMLIISIALLSLVSCGGSSQRTMYKEAMQAIEDESYEDAINILTELGDYKDAPDQLLNAWYLYGTQLFEQGELDLAEEVFTQLGDYSESAQMLDDIHYEMAEQFFSAGEYNLAMDYYNELPTAYADKVQNRIRLIECAETADRITAELQGDNNTLNFYMGMFGMEFDFDLHYEVSDHTYYFDVYCAKGFSTIASLFGSSLEDLTKDSASSGMEKTIYLKFRDAGYEDITCAMRYFDYSGNLLYSFDYSNQNYQEELKQEKAMGIDRVGDFKIQNGVLTEYSGQDTDIVIPDGVVEIGEGVFQGNETIETVTMPDSVLRIQMGAFLECKNLKSVRFSRFLEEIGYRAFESCSLTSIEYPNSIKVIGDYAFSNNKINSVSFADGTERILRNSCYSLDIQEITVPEGVQCIDEFAFINCRKLTSMILPVSLKTLSSRSLDRDIDEIIYSGTMAQLDNIEVTDYIEQTTYSATDYFSKKIIFVQCSDGVIDNRPNWSPYDGSDYWSPVPEVGESW